MDMDHRANRHRHRCRDRAIVVLLAACIATCGCRRDESPDQPVKSDAQPQASPAPNRASRAMPDSHDDTPANPTKVTPRPPDPVAPPPPGPLPDPDLSALAPAIRTQIADARRAAAAQPDDADAVGKVGMLYQAYELLDAAEMWYRRAIQLEPERFRWHYLLAHTYAHQGDADQAVAAFVRAIMLNPDYLPAKITLANLLVNAGLLDDALTVIEDAQRYDNESPIVRYTAGMIHMARQEYEDAAELFEPILESQPQLGGVRSVLATAYRRMGRDEDAERLVADRTPNTDTPRLSDPQRAVAYRLATGYGAEVLKGTAYMQQNRYREAIEHFDRAIAFEPDDPQARLAKADALVALRRFDDAERLLRDVVTDDDGNIDAWLRLGDVLLKRNKPKACAPIIARLDKRAPDNLTLVGLKARYATVIGQYDLALAAYEHLARVNPENTAVLMELAHARVLAGSTEQAKTAYRRVLTLDPDRSDAMYRMALIFRDEGNLKKAIAWFQRATSGTSAPAMCYTDYATAAARIDDYATCARVIEEGRRRFPSNGALALMQARLFAMCPEHALRDPTGALRIARQLRHSAATANNPYVVDVLAVALAANGDKTQAVDLLEQLLADKANLDPRTTRALTAHLDAVRNGRTPSEPPMWQ